MTATLTGKQDSPLLGTRKVLEHVLQEMRQGVYMNEQLPVVNSGFVVKSLFRALADGVRTAWDVVKTERVAKPSCRL